MSSAVSNVWDSLGVGDIVLLEKGDDIVQTEVGIVRGTYLGFPLIGQDIAQAKIHGWVPRIVRKSAHTVPTAPGIYVSLNPNFNPKQVHLRAYYEDSSSAEGADVPLWWEDMSLGRVIGKVLSADYLPLERLERKSETVKAVRDWFLNSEHSRGSVDEDAALMRALEKEFGVEE